MDVRREQYYSYEVQFLVLVDANAYVLGHWT